jgi:hypothetical protein
MRKVVILGFAANQRFGAVNDDRWSDAEVWTVNDWWNFYRDLAHPSRVYQIHMGLNKWNGGSATHAWRETPNWREKYNESGALIVVNQRVPELVRQRQFQVDKAVAEFGVKNIQSSIDYMLIDAMWEKVDEVELVGVGLKGNGEYENQIPSAIRNVDECRLRGIRVTAPDYDNWKAMYEKHGVQWEMLRTVDLMYGSVSSQKVMLKLAEARNLIKARVKI